MRHGRARAVPSGGEAQGLAAGPVLGKAGEEVADRHRAADEVALDVAAAVAAGGLALVLRLDPLRDPVEAEVAAQVEDRGDHAPADLGVVIADDDGAIAFRGVVPEDTDPGEHTIVVMQADADIASTPVLILAADEPGVPGGPGTPGTPGGGTPGGGTPGGGVDGPGGLPATGGDLTWLPWTLAIALLLLGSGAVAVRLRRGATTD